MTHVKTIQDRSYPLCTSFVLPSPTFIAPVCAMKFFKGINWNAFLIVPFSVHFCSPTLWTVLLYCSYATSKNSTRLYALLEWFNLKFTPSSEAKKALGTSPILLADLTMPFVGVYLRKAQCIPSLVALFVIKIAFQVCRYIKRHAVADSTFFKIVWSLQNAKQIFVQRSSFTYDDGK